VTLAAGTRLGPYEILAPLGAGGMGEVYRARDAKLNRDLAIKVLPEAVAADPERLARFQREAQLLAALNHPHIGAIYGLVESGGVEALVLELVEGETLAERLGVGAMPVDEALAVARQIGEALEAAHEKGIVHRDLKPANVTITPDGSVKVLDFGLAKALAVDGSASDVTRSPTITAAATQAGVVIGTAAYMSPEQARGRPVDKRSDIWSFGVVLFEMLTGHRCFEGETVSDVLAAVLRQDPDWSKLPAGTPPQVRALLARCLERDPKKRLRDIGDAWIETAPSIPAPTVPSRRRSPLGWVATVFVAVAALAIGFAAARWLTTPVPPAKAAAIHSVVPLPPGTRLSGWASPILAISRNGRTLAFVAEKEGEPQKLWVHRLDRDDTRVVPDSASAEGPFFSPDGQWVGFATDVSQASRTGNGELRKYSLTTGLTQKIGDIPDYYGGSWADDGTIVVAVSTTEGLWRFPAGGGKPDTSAETVLSQGKRVRRHLAWPQWLKSTEVLVTEEGESPWGGAAVLALPTRALTALERGVSFSRYTSDGRLLMSHSDRTLFAVPFDPRGLRTSGPAVAVLREVAFGCNGGAAFDVSENGTLVYASGYIRGSGLDLSRLARVSEKGEIELLPFDADTFGRVAMPSPDGRSLAVMTSGGSVWIYDLVRRIRRALPLGKVRGQGYSVVWSPDGRSIAYTASSEGSQGWGIYRQAANGSGVPEELVPPGEEAYALAFTSDGSSFISTEFAEHPSLSRRSLNGKGEASKIVDGLVAGASFSPDGRWLAYDRQDSDGWQVLMMPASGEGPRVPLATGARFPRWSPDGRSVYCRQGDALVRILIPAGDHPEPGAPEVLFKMPLRGYSVAPDGKGFYAVVDFGDSGIVKELHLVTNWFTELEALVSPQAAK
jgi:eukaryotic-like serine/threonine-protein kinase